MNAHLNILIVEDDPDILFATARIVESQGYTVLQATTGGECKSLLKETMPDLILLDVELPDMNGADLCRDIKSDPLLKGIFIVLTSGMRTSSQEQAYGLEFGADAYIARPISNRELKARINAMVRILVAERDRDRLIQELQEALSRVKRLSGLLPFCSYCKKIRDDNGYWEQVEDYIQKHSEAKLGDSICPTCARNFFPGVNIYSE